MDEHELQQILAKLPEEEPITQLLHPEVRYEVTDHCNAKCIMCPRDEHEFGREHGIMNQMHNYMLIKRDLFGRKARRNTSSSYFEMITSS